MLWRKRLSAWGNWPWNSSPILVWSSNWKNWHHARNALSFLPPIFWRNLLSESWFRSGRRSRSSKSRSAYVKLGAVRLGRLYRASPSLGWPSISSGAIRSGLCVWVHWRNRVAHCSWYGVRKAWSSSKSAMSLGYGKSIARAWSFCSHANCFQTLTSSSPVKCLFADLLRETLEKITPPFSCSWSQYVDRGAYACMSDGLRSIKPISWWVAEKQ